MAKAGDRLICSELRLVPVPRGCWFVVSASTNRGLSLAGGSGAEKLIFAATHWATRSSLAMMEEVRKVPKPARGAVGGTLEALFLAEYAPMVRLAYTLVGNSAEAEEQVQDSFAEVHCRWGEIDAPGAYLRTTVVHRCRSLLRRRRVMQHRPPRAPEALADHDVVLWDVLQRLSEDQRVAVVLRYYGRYRASEIAEVMAMPASTVRSHLRRGLAALREELES